MNLTSICSSPTLLPTSQVDACKVWHNLQHLETTYSGFGSWYWGKVVPGVTTGHRRILSAECDGVLSGVVIAKSEGEKKICTVWVPEQFRGQLVATRLMEDAMEWLDSEKPLFSVPSFRKQEFQAIVKKFGFQLEQTVHELYGTGRVEHVYNGTLKTKIDA
ncbi:hypothetical protein C8N36_107117 [Pelagimonas varians]|uniref:N-acetyltransferase domain-containing protein n=2 Tax=Pelagimonas varians TaxID=696760 RepID=A0A238KDL0_9RHOB|nr:hypothetical protein C8N36_107117 [Pelagimonas varians]SMX40667.1 hypothetical protein PEV8663_02078 [Pelagimonas varians]